MSWKNYAAALKDRLPIADRRKDLLNDVYRRTIPESAWLGEKFNLWRFNIQVPRKEELLEKIFASGLFASGHFRPATQVFGGGPAPHAEKLHSSVVNLFNDQNANEAHAREVAAIVARHITDHDMRAMAAPVR